jgi:hypothetical protein
MAFARHLVSFRLRPNIGVVTARPRYLKPGQEALGPTIRTSYVIVSLAPIQAREQQVFSGAKSTSSGVPRRMLRSFLVWRLPELEPAK